MLKKKSINLYILQSNLKNNCSNQLCFPPVGNLLVGRSNFLYASSTCGLTGLDRFCVLGSSSRSSKPDTLMTLYENNIQRSSECDYCKSTQKFDLGINNISHRIENVIYSKKPTRLEARYKWWQSENGINQVFIQFDLESEFILAGVFILFKSFPPAAMVIEKSNDYGLTWQIMAYFAYNCQEVFPGIALKRTSNYDTPICLSSYSSIESKELFYRPLRGLIHPDLLARYFKFTNLRINFTLLHMFGDNYMNKRDESVINKYYYAIRELRITGNCFCNGHSSRCIRTDGVEYDLANINDMVHGKCECEHFTHGQNCELCLPLYNDRPWSAATHSQPNQCKPCECNDHANSCHFSAERYQETGGSSGGVCNNCLHNTEGPNCERCKENFYHDLTLPFSHPDACKRTCF